MNWSEQLTKMYDRGIISRQTLVDELISDEIRLNRLNKNNTSYWWYPPLKKDPPPDPVDETDEFFIKFLEEDLGKEKKKEPEKCTCPRMDVINFGCKCGGV